MGGSIVGLAVLLTGINVGWEKLPDGGYVYIIQIEPESLDALRAGCRSRAIWNPAFVESAVTELSSARGSCPEKARPTCRKRRRAQPVSDRTTGRCFAAVRLGGKPVPRRAGRFLS